MIQPTIEVAPGITIPIGPPTTVPATPAARRRTPLPAGSAPGSSRRRRDRTPRSTEHQHGCGGFAAAAWPPIRRSADDRDLPSRTDVLGAALSQTIGGPVGRHALIGRQRFLTPLRVMFLIALVFLALGYSTKAACLQSTSYRACRPAGGQLAERPGLLRAVLFRHRPPVHRGIVEPGHSSRTSRAGWRKTPAASRRPSTTAAPPCGTWNIRCSPGCTSTRRWRWPRRTRR